MTKTLAAAVALLAGCSNPQDTLPPMMGAGDASCSDEPRPQQPEDVSDACFWLPPFGSLVVGTVEGIGSSTAPFDDGSCEGINRALVVRLHVDELLWGDETPDSIEVRFGESQIAEWSPCPLIKSDGTIEWTTPSDDGAGPLVVGQRLGLHIDAPDDGGTFVSDKSLGLLSDGTVWLSTPACDYVLGPYPSRSALDQDLEGCSPPVDGALPAALGAATCYDGNP